MTEAEMQALAAEVLDYFIEVMPDAPFSAEDIVIEFAPKNKMVERYKALAEKYKPTMQLTAGREYELANSIVGNALIGRGKSAVLMLLDLKCSKTQLKHDVFHELSHIFCGKLENSESYIDVYGDGTTGTDNPDNTMEDGIINAGYCVWSEFIAEYFALKFTKSKYKLAEMTQYICELLGDAVPENQLHAKPPFAYACAYFLNATDVVEEFADLSEEHDDSAEGTAFYSCLGILYKQIQKEKPWEISEEFIQELGSKYLMYLTALSIKQIADLD